MKIKLPLIVVLVLLLIVSIVQIFSVPPYEGDVARLYKSGYFVELDRGFGVIKDSFLAVKTFGKTVYGWIFLEDLKKKYGWDIRVYDMKGREVRAPGEYRPCEDNTVLRLLGSLKPDIQSEVRGTKYYAAIPLRSERRCQFCHRNEGLIGVMTFERNYNGRIYYSSERIILFLVLSLLIVGMLFLVIKWDPSRSVKELFDK